MSPPARPIAGRYRVESRLGVGGMSTVMLAFDERLERYVAIKLLAEHLADDPAFVSRFRREALAAARLVHPNIVQVFDFGLDRESHQHFIVMEHVSGRSCAQLLRDRGHLDVPQAVEIVTQACRGLDYAHRNGVVHRDVKPGNLLVSDTDVVKLADFGIARATDQSSITQAGSVLGTAAYLAPEQARGEEAGPRADIYSLGVVAYQLLSGRLPYEAASLSELALKQQREAPIPLTQLNPLVPAELADAITVAIDIDPQGRPEDAIEFAELIADGVKGISPFEPEAPTRALGSSGAFTRVLPSHAPPTAATRVVRQPAPAAAVRAARPAPPRAVPPRTVPSRTVPDRGAPPVRSTAPRRAAPAPRRRGRLGRFVRRLALSALVLLVLAGAIAGAAVYLANHAQSAVVHYENVVSTDLGGAISSVRRLINSNTK
jgi:serine/threonine-protein kinase